jgi:hypothetical protein
VTALGRIEARSRDEYRIDERWRDCDDTHCAAGLLAQVESRFSGSRSALDDPGSLLLAVSAAPAASPDSVRAIAGVAAERRPRKDDTPPA